jgi:hypothetical protein
MPYSTAMAHCPTGHKYVIDVVMLPSWQKPWMYEPGNRMVRQDIPTTATVDTPSSDLYDLLDQALVEAGYAKLKGWIRPGYPKPLGAKHAHVRKIAKGAAT